MTMLFFNVAWMENYQGVTENDKPVDGGSYEGKHEVCNFAPIAGRLYGYGQAGSTIDLKRLGHDKEAHHIDCATIVWCARHPDGRNVMVGYYRNAQIYREKQSVPVSPVHIANKLELYWVECRADDGVCLPIAGRKLIIPRGAGAFGQSNIWYGDTSLGPETIKHVQNFIVEYETERLQTDGHKAAIASGSATAGTFDEHQRAIEQDVKDIMASDMSETEKTRQVQARLGQGKFRDDLMGLSGDACSVTGCTIKEILRASHIKPWSLCDIAEERLSPDNGLILTANLDALFDRGLISFSDDGKMLDRLNIPDYQRKEYHIGKPLLKKLDDKKKPFLQFHRTKYGFD